MNLVVHHACCAPFSLGIRVGALLPDLLRMFHGSFRTLRLLKYWRSQIEDDRLRRELCQGIDLHLAADRHFHQNPLFQKTQQALLKSLHQAEPQQPHHRKRFFCAHLLTELWLDWLWLQSHPQQAQQLYQDLLAIQTHLVQLLQPPLIPSGFSNFCQQIHQNRLLYSYADAHQLLPRTERICARLRIAAFSQQEKQAATQCLQTLQSRTQPQLLHFVRTMQALT